jgi:hypothetical protein
MTLVVVVVVVVTAEGTGAGVTTGCEGGTETATATGILSSKGGADASALLSLIVISLLVLTYVLMAIWQRVVVLCYVADGLEK